MIIHPGRDERSPFEIMDILERAGSPTEKGTLIVVCISGPVCLSLSIVFMQEQIFLTL